MRTQWKRWALAACLSLGCGSATLIWYYSTEKKLSFHNDTPLAQVAKVGDEVLRRPATRLLWEQINTGDNLYSGETIHTSALGELRIQFEDGRYIDLEPDSLIVLQKLKGEISLDLMEGSAFVNAKSEGSLASAKTSGLVMNSKSGKVDLSGASAAVSKGSGGRVDMQVIDGKATIRGADGKEKQIAGNSTFGESGLQFDNSNLKILSPPLNRPMFVDLTAENPVLFKWQGYPANWKVSIFAGPTRKDLHAVASTTKPGESELNTKMSLGKYWWHLVATDPQTGKIMAESPVARMTVQARYAPTMIFPTANAEILMEKNPYDMNFKWEKSEEANKIQLEVSNNPNLKPLILNKAFREQDEVMIPALKDGVYYWRMSAFYDGAEKPALGKIQSFRLMKQAHVKKDPVHIEWNLAPEQLTQNFGTSPKLQLHWSAKNRAEDIVGYHIRIEDGQPNGDTVHLDSKETKAEALVAKAGRYIASVEAYDKDGAVIGKSEPLALAAKELPLLKSPTLLPADGDLHSGNDGRTSLQWTELPGAKSFTLTITGADGKELAKKSYPTNSASLKNLMPGTYTVKLEAVDTFGRASEGTTVRTLIVPDKSGLRAPTMKRIKVN